MIALHILEMYLALDDLTDVFFSRENNTYCQGQKEKFSLPNNILFFSILYVCREL